MPAVKENRIRSNEEAPEPKKRSRKKGTPKGERSPRQPLRITWPWERWDEPTRARAANLLGLGLGLFSVFLLVAVLSHLFAAGNADQSFVEYGAVPPTDIGRLPENAAGSLGAWLANALITKGFGLFGLLVPVYGLLAGLALLDSRPRPLARRLGWPVFYVVHWGSFALGFATVLFGFKSFDIGGGLGVSLTQWFSFYLGMVGTGILLVFIMAAYVLFAVGSFAIPWARYRQQLATPFGETKTTEAENDETTTPGAQDTQDAELPETEPEDENWEDEFIVSVRKVLDGSEELPLESTHQEDQPKVLKPKEEHEPTGGDLELVIEEGKKEDAPEPPASDDDNLVQVGEDTYHKYIADEDSESLLDDDVLAEWEDYDPTLELSSYQHPTIELLNSYENPNGIEVNREELEANKNRIVKTLANYNIEITSIKATVGPTVTLYEIVPAPGIRISKIRGLEDDIALSLAALGIRIIAPMPGKGTIGIEIPNSKAEIVGFRSVVATEKFKNSKAELPIAFGKTISNEVFIADLADMPHLLVAGATGQGKSVGLNTIIASLLYKKHPAQVKFVLIDPKKVEMAIYQPLVKHFLAKLPNYEDAIITDNKQVIHVLTSLCIEMDQRYELLKAAKVRKIAEYNEKFIRRRLNPKNGHRYLPYIVLVIDELADLMMTAGKEVEAPICRLAQLARAVGIHLVLATQRPSVNIITGSIKTNFPARLSYRVISKVDSRTILDSNGADQLIGRGDMLFSKGADLTRLQNAFIDTPEIDELVEFIGSQRGYPTPYYLPEVEDEESGLDGLDSDELDSLFMDAARLVVRSQQGSTSMIQRKMSIGYNRAGRIMDQLERAGIVGQASGSKPREVLVADEAELERFLSTLSV